MQNMQTASPSENWRTPRNGVLWATLGETVQRVHHKAKRGAAVVNLVTVGESEQDHVRDRSPKRLTVDQDT